MSPTFETADADPRPRLELITNPEYPNEPVEETRLAFVTPDTHAETQRLEDADPVTTSNVYDVRTGQPITDDKYRAVRKQGQEARTKLSPAAIVCRGIGRAAWRLRNEYVSPKNR
jgi:hypothetical protein